MLASDPTGIVVAAAHGKITGIDLATGATRWTQALLDLPLNRAQVPWDMQVVDGRVFAATLGHLFSLDQASGQVIFHAHVPVPVGDAAARTTLLVVQAGVLVARLADLHLFAFDGRLVWTAQLPRSTVMGMDASADLALGISGHVRQVDRA